MNDRDTHIYQNSDFLALQAAYLEDPSHFGPPLVVESGQGLGYATILGDWLQDYGIEWPSWAEVVEPPTLSTYLPTDYYGIGIGRGSGRGIGSGIGSGIGIGSGSGRGSGSGSGIGSGRGSGRCIGIGSGRGSGSGRRTLMEIGKAYLVITVDWFAWVGRVVRQVGPFEWEFDSLSKISESHNGDNWQQLCEGNKAARKAASYQHYKVKGLLGIGSVVKLEWLGKTPQEEGL